MARIEHRAAAFVLMFVAASAPLLAKEREGGYYWSLTHPDFGNVDAPKSRQNEGYYASVKKEQDDAYATARKSQQDDASLTAPKSRQDDASASAPKTQQDDASASAPKPQTNDTQANNTQAPQNQPEKQAAESTSTQPLKTAGTGDPALAPLPVLPGKVTLSHRMNSFEQGKFAFEQGAFHQAEECFQNAVKGDPLDQKAHLWLGLSKLRLYDYDGAHDELELAFRLNPFSDEGKQARERLLEVAQIIQKQNSEPVDPPWLVRQTLRITARQARMLQAQKIAEGNAVATWRGISAQRTAARLNDQTSWYLQGYYQNYSAYNNWSDVQEISNANFIRTHYIMTDAQVQGAIARKDGVDRANNIQSSVNGFFDLLGQKPKDGTPRVRAFGSNLYVRYYGKEAVDAPPTVAAPDPPLKAVTMHYGK